MSDFRPLWGGGGYWRYRFGQFSRHFMGGSEVLGVYFTMYPKFFRRLFCSFFYPQVGVVLGLILVPNGKHFGKMLGDEYSHYEPQ